MYKLVIYSPVIHRYFVEVIERNPPVAEWSFWEGNAFTIDFDENDEFSEPTAEMLLESLEIMFPSYNLKFKTVD